MGMRFSTLLPSGFVTLYRSTQVSPSLRVLSLVILADKPYSSFQRGLPG